MATKRAALYVRVSTDKKTVENKVRELTAMAQRRGWEVVATYSDGHTQDRPRARSGFGHCPAHQGRDAPRGRGFSLKTFTVRPLIGPLILLLARFSLAPGCK